jgi:hypothetical protein
MIATAMSLASVARGSVLAVRRKKVKSTQQGRLDYKNVQNAHSL